MQASTKIAPSVSAAACSTRCSPNGYASAVTGTRAAAFRSTSSGSRARRRQICGCPIRGRILSGKRLAIQAAPPLFDDEKFIFPSYIVDTSVNDMSAASLPHDHAIAVGADQIDFMGHVNNAHYLSWVQEAVLSHWRHIAPPGRGRGASVGRAEARDHLSPPRLSRRRGDRHRDPRKGAGRSRLLRNDHQARRGRPRRGQIELVLHRRRNIAPCAPRERSRRALLPEREYPRAEGASRELRAYRIIVAIVDNQPDTAGNDRDQQE